MSKQERKQHALTSMCRTGLTSFFEQQSDIMGLRARVMRPALSGSIIPAALSSLKGEVKKTTIQNRAPACRTHAYDSTTARVARMQSGHLSRGIADDDAG